MEQIEQMKDSANFKMPESIKEHQPKYKEDAWKQYSIIELGMWIHLLVKRASHRNNKERAIKDLHDAQNYHNIMSSHIEAMKQTLNISNE